MPSPADQTDPLAQWLTDQTGELVGQLKAAGALHEQLADQRVGDVAVSIASATGEKDRNEDAIGLWIPSAGSAVRWAAAIADGVSACLYPHLASRLACVAGLAAVPSTDELSPIQAAQQRFDELDKLISEDLEAMRPEGVTSSMWKRVVRDGAYAQTTLTVLWEIDDTLHVEGIGDGGVLIDGREDAFEHVPDFNQAVRCLGPGRGEIGTDYRMAYSQWRQVTVFTDGMTPWVQSHGAQILRQSNEDHRVETAEALVERSIQEMSIRDNVSLLIAARETP